MSYSINDVRRALTEMKAYRSEAKMVIEVLKQTVKSVDEISICEVIDGLRMLSISNFFIVQLLYQLNKETPTV